MLPDCGSAAADFLNGVAGVAGRAQRVVSDPPGRGPVGLEPIRELDLFVHRPHPLVMVFIYVTGQTLPM